MPNIPVYGDYRTRLADAPNVRQDLQTDTSMFGGNQARAFGAWASSLKGASEIVKSIGGMVGAGQAGGGGLGGIPVADSAGAGGTVQPGIDLFRSPGAPPASGDELPDLDRKAFSMLDAGPAPSAPEPQPIAAPKAEPAPEQQADFGAVFVRPSHTPASLLEYRESQNDLADTLREWRRAVGRGEMNTEDVRDLLHDEIRGHTRSMKTAEAVRALTDWGERQIAAIAVNEGSPENRLAAAANRRLDRRAEDVVQAGGDLKVLAGQLARATRDVWEDGEALGLPAERIDANVRRARDTLSATAVLAAAGHDRELGARTLAVLRDKNMISDGAAEPLTEILTALHDPGEASSIRHGGAGRDVLPGDGDGDTLDGGKGDSDATQAPGSPGFDSQSEAEEDPFARLRPSDLEATRQADLSGDGNAADMRSFLEQIERGASDGDGAIALTGEEKAFADAYRKAFAERSQGAGLETTDAETVEKWRAAALQDAAALLGRSDPQRPAAGALFLKDYANEQLAAIQRTSPHVVDGEGNYTYARAPDSEQAFLRENDRVSDSEKFVVLIDPKTGEPTAWNRDPEKSENRLTSLGRLVGLGILGRGPKSLTSTIRLARASAQSVPVAERLARAARMLGENRRFGQWVDEVRTAQAARAAGESFAKPVQPFRFVGSLDADVREFLKSKGVDPETDAITVTRPALAHLTRPGKAAATTAEGLSKAVPLDMVKRMPEILSRPSAVLWDKQKENLLYVFNVSDDPRKGKFVVEVNYAFRYRPGGTGKSTTRTINHVVSAGMAGIDDLTDANRYHKVR